MPASISSCHGSPSRTSGILCTWTGSGELVLSQVRPGTGLYIPVQAGAGIPRMVLLQASRGFPRLVQAGARRCKQYRISSFRCRTVQVCSVQYFPESVQDGTRRLCVQDGASQYMISRFGTGRYRTALQEYRHQNTGYETDDHLCLNAFCWCAPLFTWLENFVIPVCLPGS